MTLQLNCACFEGVSAASSKESRAAELAKLRCLSGWRTQQSSRDRNGLEPTLTRRVPRTDRRLAIINENLLAALDGR